jgi:hypothetical protein
VKYFVDEQYNSEGHNGTKLSLLNCCDKWDTVENFEKRILNKIKKKDIIENDESDFNKTMLANIDVFVHFKMKFFQKYLIMVRNSGIINMFGASPYLYVGRQKIEEEIPEFMEISTDFKVNEFDQGYEVKLLKELKICDSTMLEDNSLERPTF